MTPIILLERLKEFIADEIKDIMLPVRASKGNEQKERAADVYKMRLPNKEAETKQVPYVLLQVITGKDDQQIGEQPESECKIRIIVTTFSENDSEGALDTLNVLTRIRIALLKIGVIGNQFLVKGPLEYIAYPDDTRPYFVSEMIVPFSLPTIHQEVGLH